MPTESLEGKPNEDERVATVVTRLPIDRTTDFEITLKAVNELHREGYFRSSIG
ncbi:MAG: hypothetical protein JOZ21_10345 [Verrucomicrobia bacterium]|nr:hypothetical protein [Verrucomicrobiota bacterium]